MTVTITRVFVSEIDHCNMLSVILYELMMFK